MIGVNITELKRRLSHYLRLVKKGETIEVLNRSTPVARLTKVAAGGSSEGTLERLIAEGLVKAPAVPPDPNDFDEGPLVACKGDAVKAVIEGRGDW
ncbi:MAG: type II toxin-antitoxin system prevent-host-death family antitoxin [Planctomycetota bacterium]